MNTARGKSVEGLRVILAVAAKDVVDAMKNKTTISVIIGMFLMMLSAQAFPFIMKLAAIPRMIVYDAGSSRLIAELEDDGQYRLVKVDSKLELEEILVDMNAEVLGLVIPPGFDQALASGEPEELEGYVVWSSRSAASELKSNLEAHLERLLGQPVRVSVEGNVVYPSPEGSGHLVMVAGVLVVALGVVGSLMVPYLMFEEKQTHTMEVLLVSPATAGQIVAGKALTGLFYCLTAVAVAFAFNYNAFTHWGIAVLAAICGALVAIAVGLVLGSLFETAQQMSLWVSIPLVIIFLPVMLKATELSLPAALASFLSWLPTAALADVFLLSFSGNATLARALPELALVLAWAVPVYAAEVWIVRRSDR